MSIAALTAWVLTAGGGFALLAVWLTNGGLEERGGRASRFPPRLIFGHMGLAAAGLFLWVLYLVTDSAALAWAALVFLLPVGALGATMFIKWVGGRASATAERQPEQHFPTLVVAGHGVAAVATVVLVLIAAIQA